MKIRANRERSLLAGSRGGDLMMGSAVETGWRDSVCVVFGVDVDAEAMELCPVPEPVGIDSVTESLEKMLFALLDHVEYKPRTKVTLDDVDDPLVDSLYKFGKILPRPIAQSIRL